MHPGQCFSLNGVLQEVGELLQWVKCFLCEREDRAQIPRRKQGRYGILPVILAYGDQGQEIPRTSWIVRLAKMS